MFSIRRIIFGLAAVLMLPLTTEVSASEPLQAPTGQVLLTVSGEIFATNHGDAAQFDLDMLRRLPRIEFRTTTLWTDGEKTFVGVPLSALLDHLGANSGQLRALAINDYSVTFDLVDIGADAPIVAYLMDGQTMSRRDKGPLWVVYPYDSDAAYQSEVIYSRSIWQLDRLVVTR